MQQMHQPDEPRFTPGRNFFGNVVIATLLSTAVLFIAVALTHIPFLIALQLILLVVLVITSAMIKKLKLTKSRRSFNLAWVVIVIGCAMQIPAIHDLLLGDSIDLVNLSIMIAGFELILVESRMIVENWPDSKSTPLNIPPVPEYDVDQDEYRPYE